MNPAEIVALCRERGVELFEGRKPDRLRVCSRGKLPPDLRRLLRENKAALIAHLAEPATPEELAAVAATGRNPSPLLTRAQARELSLLPAPPKPDRWEAATCDFWTARLDSPLRPWQKRPVSDAQRFYLRKHGFEPPADATCGEASYLISQLKQQRRNHVQ
jgi:hypothetical protein